MSHEELSEDLLETFRVIWTIGIFCGSTTALVIQILLLILIPNVRKVRLLIITHMTTARYIYGVLEYLINYINFTIPHILADALISVYFQVDAILICWMCVFTGNLFYKVVIIVPHRKFYFKTTSILIWTLTIPFGYVCLQDLYIGNLYNAYAIVKFVVLGVNSCLTIWSFVVAVKLRHKEQSNEFKNVMKICVMALIIFSVTSVQSFITDIQSFMNMGGNKLMFILCLVNSFQAITMTILFCILANRACDNSLLQKLSTKLKQVYGTNQFVCCVKKNDDVLSKNQSTLNV